MRSTMGLEYGHKYAYSREAKYYVFTTAGNDVVDVRSFDYLMKLQTHDYNNQDNLYDRWCYILNSATPKTADLVRCGLFHRMIRSNSSCSGIRQKPGTQIRRYPQ